MHPAHDPQKKAYRPPQKGSHSVEGLAPLLQRCRGGAFQRCSLGSIEALAGLLHLSGSGLAEAVCVCCVVFCPARGVTPPLPLSLFFSLSPSKKGFSSFVIQTLFAQQATLWNSAVCALAAEVESEL